MERIFGIFALILGLAAASTVPAPGAHGQPAFVCNECHSKHPASRRMHEAVRGMDCFACHERGKTLRRKGGIPPEVHAAFLEQRTSDKRCIACHDQETVAAHHPEAEAAAGGADAGEAVRGSALSGLLYCPSCKVKVGAEGASCPRCRSTLINLDELMRRAAEAPDAAQCRICHAPDETLKRQHQQVETGAFGEEADCLRCHEGHNQCARCHH